MPSAHPSDPLHTKLRYRSACGCGHIGRRAFATALLAGAALPAAAVVPECKRSVAAKLIPASQVEGAAQQQYAQLVRGASSQGALARADNLQLQRLRYIAARIVPLAPACNDRASQWRWEVNLLGSQQVNAFCMPGGKIAFYSGIIENLRLSDDEIAIVMGHEMSHALREHARARLAQQAATNIGASLLSQIFGLGNAGNAVLSASASLIGLRFSRDDETEADAVGQELAARAGYDPRAGVSLWQKMQASHGGGPPQWLSSHPADGDRVTEIQRHLPEVMPLYEKARRR